MKNIRIWFLDETYLDTDKDGLKYWRGDPQFKCVEFLNKCDKDINEEDV